MAIIRYEYNEMLKKADELEAILPSLLKAEDWNGIRKELFIPKTIWDGNAAKSFAVISIALCNIHSEGVLQLPSKIRNAVTTMQKRERELAKIADSLLNF